MIAGETVLCQIDEGESGLRYRGYAIGDLAEQATFEEVSYLLLLGKLPGSGFERDRIEVDPAHVVAQRCALPDLVQRIGAIDPLDRRRLERPVDLIL